MYGKSSKNLYELNNLPLSLLVGDRSSDHLSVVFQKINDFSFCDKSLIKKRLTWDLAAEHFSNRLVVVNSLNFRAFDYEGFIDRYEPLLDRKRESIKHMFSLLEHKGIGRVKEGYFNNHTFYEKCQEGEFKLNKDMFGSEHFTPFECALFQHLLEKNIGFEDVRELYTFYTKVQLRHAPHYR